MAEQVDSMNNIMAVLLNGIAQLEYRRDKPLPDVQAQYLDQMDERMNAGIELGDEHVAQPDLDQRARFVAANLVHAIQSDDETKAAAFCTYLAVRLPELQQLKIQDTDGKITIEFVFDEPYKKQVAVSFTHLH